MARKRKDKEKVTDPFERARLKKLRAAQRREERKRRKAEAGDSDEPRRKRSAEPDYSQPLVKDDWLWIRKGLAKDYAIRIINNHRERPYWLSIPRPTGLSVSDRAPPVSNLYPCTMFSTKGRIFYGFLFREHRDLFFSKLGNARKEVTDRVRAINPTVV